MSNNVQEGKYIYCIIDAKDSVNFGPIGIGGRDDEVYTISFNDIAAVVSKSPIIEYPLSRNNILAHEKAIEKVMKSYSVLPTRFSTIAENENVVKGMLEREYIRFIKLFEYIRDKKESGVQAIFNKDTVYKSIVEKYEDIKELKNKIDSMPPQKSHYQRVEIGKMVESALEKEKNICKELILNTLSSLSVDVKINNVYNDLMIMNTAFLVEKKKGAEFEAKIEELAEEYTNEIKFRIIEALPPFNFVNLIINMKKDNVSN